MLNKNEANKRLIEKINALEESYPKNFSNTQKILLTTDGSITAILDVLYGKINHCCWFFPPNTDFLIRFRCQKGALHQP